MRFPSIKEFTSCGLVLAISCALVSVGFSQENKSTSSFAEKELHKRRAAVEEAQMLLLKGDEAYIAGNFKDAVDAYAGATSAFPDSPTTTELRNSALERYAQASVEYAKSLARKGQIKEARAVIDVVLAEEVTPNNPAAIAARDALDDPILTNPALTGKHAKDVDQVRRLLYMADGAYDLGKFDEAQQHCISILKIDPHNHAATRGLERIANEKSKYFKSAYSQTRGEALMEVDRNWQIPLQSNLVIPSAPFVDEATQKSSYIPLGNKLIRIVVPKFIVEDVTLMEAIDALRARAIENDVFELVPNLKGINITLNLGDPLVSPAKEILEKRFDLRVSNVPVESILKYITEMTQTHFRYDDHAVTITQRGVAGGGLISRTYRVPPDFVSNLSLGAKEKAKDDIFNAKPDENGLLAKRMGAQEALAEQGVSFSDGASATYNPSSNTLLVINTINNHDIIQQIIDTIVEAEPVIISVKVTMVKVEKSILEELGFDWMLNDFGLGGKSGLAPNAGYLSGGTVGTGTIDDFPLVPGNPAPRNPVTAANRSGDSAFARFNLDQLLDAGGRRNVQEFDRAPGIIGVNGVVNDTTIALLMRGLDQKKATDVLATPSITTRSGQVASIKMVKEFIYPTEYEPPELPQSINSFDSPIFDNQGNQIGINSVLVTPPIVPAFPTSFETRDTGVFLEVLPTADANRQYIDVALKPVITDFEGYVNYGTPINLVANGTTTVLAENPILMPVFGVKKVDTSMVILDGATVVVGGLLKDTVVTVNDKTPILGDLPMVGSLFQTNGTKQLSTAILFFVNVELVDPTGRPYRKR
jgi:general secretion pathway protein D